MGMLELLLGDPPSCPDCGYRFPYIATPKKRATCPQCGSTTLSEQVDADLKKMILRPAWITLKIVLGFLIILLLVQYLLL